ncbi:hypothetical protein [Streptomyces halstedii]|uniref:hypothetical protein n=1 Tax=Streptomyces halstedii TaxID=1944 RepID=UPI00380A0136
MTPATRAPVRSRPGRPRRLRDVSPGRRGLVLAWFGFTVAFGLMRLLTWLIHIDVAGVGDVSAGGVHIHHYVWVILLLLVVGAVGLVERSPRIRAWLGLGYGVGAALVIDEAALLLSLEDVYWDDEGGISIALALIVIGVAGSLLVLTRRPTEDSGGGADERRSG